MSKLSRWLLGTLSVVVISAAGMGVGFWLGSPAIPAQLQPGGELQVSPVTPREVDDSRQVEVSVELVSQAPLRSAAAGLVTSLNCRVGESLSSGTVALSVDGSSIVALSTSVPLWRPLDVSSTGEDVRALQEAMADLGYDIAPDGEMGEYTLAMVANLLGLSTQEAVEYDQITPSSFLWLPAQSVTVGACPVEVGATVEVGAELFTLQNSLSEVRVKELPGDLVGGERTLVIDDVQAVVDEEGAVTDSEALALIQMTPSFVEWINSEDKAVALRGRLVLSAPMTVYTLAPAAVYGIQGTQGCVLAGDQSLPVTIVSSELGQTFVSFAPDATIPTSVTVGASEGPACR